MSCESDRIVGKENINRFEWQVHGITWTSRLMKIVCTDFIRLLAHLYSSSNTQYLTFGSKLLSLVLANILVSIFFASLVDSNQKICHHNSPLVNITILLLCKKCGQKLSYDTKVWNQSMIDWFVIYMKVFQCKKKRSWGIRL